MPFIAASGVGGMDTVLKFGLMGLSPEDDSSGPLYLKYLNEQK